MWLCIGRLRSLSQQSPYDAEIQREILRSKVFQETPRDFKRLQETPRDAKIQREHGIHQCLQIEWNKLSPKNYKVYRLSPAISLVAGLELFTAVDRFSRPEWHRLTGLSYKCYSHRWEAASGEASAALQTNSFVYKPPAVQYNSGWLHGVLRHTVYWKTLCT